jgi:diacylglycerol O-acyltransferase / wax synthase
MYGRAVAGDRPSELRYDDWMSESDSVLWHIERDPLLRSTITSVWFLDRVPDRRRMDAVVDRIVAEIPRLHQRVVDEQPGVAPPRWADDPHVDVGYHYSWTRLAGRAPKQRDVLDFAQRLAARAFDKDRPLWELCVVEGLPGKRAAFIMKVHHAIADGLGMVQLLSQMVDLEVDAASPPRPQPIEEQSGSLRVVSPLWSIPGARTLSHRIAAEAKTGVRMSKASLRTAADLLRDPLGTLEQLGRTTGSIARVVKPATTPLSPLMTGRSLNTRFDAVTVPFDEFKSVARLVNGTLNDVFVATTLDALRRYHEELGAACSQVRMNMPVSVRAGATTSRFDNQFVPARVVLPLGDGNAPAHLAEIKALLREVTAEPALPHVNDISGVISRLGPAASVSVLGAMLKGVDITTSNVPGPPFPVFMAGAKVETFYAFGPLAGAAINITLFSYDGGVHLGINADRAAVTDPDLFARCVGDSIADALALVS